MAKNPSIAIVEDDTSFASFLEMTFQEENYTVWVFHHPETALLKLPELKPDIVITDLKMPEMDGITFIKKAKKLLPESVFIVITAFGTIPSAVEAMKAGAVDYLTKPLSSPEELLFKVKNYLKNTKSFESTEGLPPFDVVFAGIEDLYEKLVEIAPTDTTVCLLGETGTGKSLIAKVIHVLSRKKGPFVEINCAALPENLVEAELFGYEKGAFTGALKTKPGKVEVARGGTLFLDEISEMSLPVQAKFLRVLQDKTFERLGGLETLKTNARFIVATNKDLVKLVAEGRFREDLFYRINVLSFYLPPLRERKKHLEKIVNYLLENICQKLGKPLKPLSKTSWEKLKEYHFPGNIRELENLLERAILLSKGETLEVEFFSKEREILKEELELKDALQIKNLEKKAILKALEVTKGNKPEAAKLLGISLKTLYNKLKEFGINQ
ncbi:sigma-54-dependent Fis family transcriptional regulator [Thermodesulfobacterium sp. TA1]|uniref:sigma-54-dependent transcriptional regulator n=1 Tax=Thermodesulfobacterium sp. TA1 TaxID=2234087 RepID=UPI001231EDA3|nr:sigma-54 dependent transcriptional regulator [Thermodesulfobacterium sp. TA1]QER42741.1 sigma-54-dependent Fis family transcriptional regulator [Thermodesulfobacterium sp. TA1]